MNKKLGDYQLLDVLGSSRISKVYSAIDGDGNHIALKLMRETPFLDKSHIIRVLENTKSISGVLHHTHIVDILDVGKIDDYYYVAMELITGPGTLEDALATGPLALDAALKIGSDLADALTHAHACNIVHGDLKPSNMLVNDHDDVLLTDFGVVSMNYSRAPGQGQVMAGTPRYMSPQQARGCFVSTLSDVYSYGVVLYEMVTGRLPYLAPTPIANLQHMIRTITSAPVVPPVDLIPTLPAALNRMLLKLIEKDEVQRYQTMKDVQSDLIDLSTQAESHDEPAPIGLWTRVRRMFSGM